MGFPGHTQYLVILQNDAERRPTGGFITKYALLSFHFGIPSLTFGDVYEKELIQPGTRMPDPLYAQLIDGKNFPGHGLRDGNTDADFPVSARELMRLFHLGYPDTQLNGVIAVDFTAVSRLLSAAHALPEPIAAHPDLLFSYLEEHVQDTDLHDVAALANRKNILADVLTQLIRNLALSPWHIRATAEEARTLLTEKHLQLYSTDAHVQAFLAEQRWDGALRLPATTDILGFIEGNYGGLKSSRYLTQYATHSTILTLDPSSRTPHLTATTTLTITHAGTYSEPISGYYQGIWKTLVPRGVTLLSGTPDTSYETPQATVFTQTVRLAPGESTTLSYTYRLPDTLLADGIYQLFLYRQSGGTPLPVTTTFHAPQGYLLSSPDFSATEHLATLTDAPATDRLLILNVFPDTSPPRVAWYRFTGGLRTVEVRFNEPLSEGSVKTAAFTITPRTKGDTIRVIGIRMTSPQTALLTLSGVSESCRALYDFTLSGIADTYGNTITEKKVTLIQNITPRGLPCVAAE